MLYILIASLYLLISLEFLFYADGKLKRSNPIVIATFPALWIMVLINLMISNEKPDVLDL